MTSRARMTGCVALGAWLLAGATVLGETPAPAKPAGEKVDLTPRYKAGEVYTFKQHIVRTETKIVGNVPAPVNPEEKAEDKKDSPASGDAATPKKDDPAKDKKPENMLRQTWSIDLTATYEVRVVSAGDTGTMLELELKAIDASADLPPPKGKAAWSSEAPEDDKDQVNPLVGTLRGLITSVLKVTIGPDGKVAQVHPDPRVNLTARGTLAPIVQELAGPDLVRARWATILVPKDGREPAVSGKSWTHVEEVPNAAVGKFVYTTTSSLKGLKDGVAAIDLTGDIKLVGMEPSKPAAGTLSEQSLKGEAEWDVKAGLPKLHVWREKRQLDVNAMGLPVVYFKELTCTTTRVESAAPPK